MVEQFFSPSPERTLDPFPDWDGKAGLWAAKQLRGRFPIKQLAEDFLASLRANFHCQGNSRCEGSDAMIEKGYPRLEAYRHRRAVHLAQDVIWQVRHGVPVHRPDGVGDPVQWCDRNVGP
jgi:hypothetical protein